MYKDCFEYFIELSSLKVGTGEPDCHLLKLPSRYCTDVSKHIYKYFTLVSMHIQC